jgi:predicted cobalt transporter CbtA
VQKALLITILAATMLTPLFAAKGGNVRAAVRRSVIATVVFCLLYWIGLVFIYPTLPAANLDQQTTQ